MYPLSVNDELQQLKQSLRALGIKVIKIEKAGNGNMAAFQLLYVKPGSDEVLKTFFWRHDTDRFLEKIEASL
ncbi:MAG: hypothetical protein QM702_20470 [Rubrivivax sp.]